MSNNKVSRRMFLRGAGSTVFAIPFLPSLLPREAWAQACANSPVRFFSLASQFGATPPLWVGNLTGNSRKAENVNVRSLAEWLSSNSSMSPIFGSDFNSVANKMSILRGLDFYSGEYKSGSPEPFHNYTGGSCAAPQFYAPTSDTNNPQNPPAINVSSIDYIIANSSVMPSHISPAYRLLSCAPTESYTIYADWGAQQNGTWKKGSSKPTYEGLIRRGNSQNLYNFMISAFSNNTMTPETLPSTTSADKDIVQSIYDDYKSIRDSSKISSADRFNLENFMALISDLMKNIASEPAPPPALSCNKPSSSLAHSDSNNDGRLRNHMDLLAAAMACDITRVANLQVNTLQRRGLQSENKVHDYHHWACGSGNAYPGDQYKNAFESNWIEAGKNVAYLLKKLNSFSEGTGGTLLDNSIVYWWSQHGLAQSQGVAHQSGDYGIMVAGGGAGSLQMGYFIDFRHQSETYSRTTGFQRNPGLPLNNLLMTFLNTFKVPANEYERPGEPGIGAYWNPNLGRWLPGLSVMSESYRNKILAMRRESLPFLFKKSAC